ncbi:MAG: cytochrome c oxidase assembly protein [Stellaceae bacterium]
MRTLLISTALTADAAPSVWSRWDLPPGIVLPFAALAVLYAAGLHRRRGRRGAGRARDMAFPGALLAIFMVLCSPLDALSEHLFWIHQIQHLVLAMLAPILVMLAAPQAALIARRGLRQAATPAAAANP